MISLRAHLRSTFYRRLLLCFPNKRGHERQICFNLNQQLVCLPLACRDRSLLAPLPPFFCMLGFDASVAETGLGAGSHGGYTRI